MDAARLLPILGFLAFLLPLLWGGGTTRMGVIYIFAVWVVLIVLSVALSRILGRAQAANPDDNAGGAP